MSQGFVKCPCLEKMVPAKDIDLTFRRPDDIDVTDEIEREEKCRYNDVIYIYEEKYFYIRCILRLSVHDTGRDYCLVVWAQVSENSFNKIWALWDDNDQEKEPPMKCLLANTIPLNSGSRNAEVLVKLTGPTSRPHMIIQEEGCSLYQEQNCGITIHRAGEYSDLCSR